MCGLQASLPLTALCVHATFVSYFPPDVFTTFPLYAPVTLRTTEVCKGESATRLEELQGFLLQYSTHMTSSTTVARVCHTNSRMMYLSCSSPESVPLPVAAPAHRGSGHFWILRFPFECASFFLSPFLFSIRSFFLPSCVRCS